MRNLIYILTFLITITLLSCGQNSSEKQLNGKWYEIENYGNARWVFHKDSLVLIADRNDKVEWNATNSKIKFELPTFSQDSLGKFIDIIDKITINYKLSSDKDSLFGKLNNRYGEHQFSLLRAENYIEFLNKKYKIRFSLPKNNSIELIKTSPLYGLNVFMGYSNNKIVGKTELSDDLNHLESDIMTFKDSIKPNGRPEVDGHDKFYDHRFHLRVFADKRISDSLITKCLSATIKRVIFKKNEHFSIPTRDTLPIKIYRIYRSKEETEFGVLNGKKIKTIANNIYVIRAD